MSERVRGQKKRQELFEEVWRRVKRLKQCRESLKISFLHYPVRAYSFDKLDVCPESEVPESHVLLRQRRDLVDPVIEPIKHRQETTYTLEPQH